MSSYTVTPSTPLLSTGELEDLNQKSNLQGLLQLGAHLTIMAASGILWASMGHIWWLGLPALIIYGFSLASMFATVHEGTHRTAFANNRLNDTVAWLAGLLCFYNSTFYRRYHKWHHRYTQIPGQDPELEDPTPTNWGEYLWQISGIPWWIGKVKIHGKMALGKTEGMPYLSETARLEVMRSTWGQLAVYGSAIALSLIFGKPWFLLYWVLPLAVGQPILRMILLAEHTGCTEDNNPLTNTRTTLTIWPIRLLMWNMAFHGEHHLYQSIPFYQLPKAHQLLSQHLTRVDAGYLRVNQAIIASFGKSP